MVNIYTHPENHQRLEPDNTFRFQCHSGLACFNECCRQPTLILKPYDILRLRRRLGITSTAFLARYTVRIMEETSRLPLRLLALREEEPGGCPFLDAACGCTVYEDRPAACRLFPVIQGSSLTEGTVKAAYFLKKLDFCQGFAHGPQWTLEQWRADQGLLPYDELNHEWVAILLEQGARQPTPGASPGANIFELAISDLDAFRRFVLESAFASTHGIQGAVADVLRQNDETLLRLGYAYARLVLGLTDTPQFQAAVRSLASPPRDS